MEPQDMKFLSQEERSIYGAWQELFGLTGFNLLVRRVQRDYDEAGALYDKVPNEIGFARLQGYRNALSTEILRVSDTVYAEYEALVADRKASHADSLEDDVEA